MLTQKDIDILETNFKKIFATKEELMQVKSDLMIKLDKILKEILASRQEQTINSHRLTKLEKIHPSGKHSQFTS